MSASEILTRMAPMNCGMQGMSPNRLNFQLVRPSAKQEKDNEKEKEKEKEKEPEPPVNTQQQILEIPDNLKKKENFDFVTTLGYVSMFATLTSYPEY